MKDQYEIGISADKTYLFARAFRVPYTAEVALKLANDLIALSENIDILGCLIDIRGTKSISSVLDKYKFAYEKTKDINLPLRLRYAFLKDPDDTSTQFFETVMKNANYMLQIFENEAEAIDWLKTHT